MTQAKICLLNKIGLHARPASLLISTAKEYDCEVKIMKGDQSCETMGLINLLRMQIKMGDELTIICTGKEEEACLEELVLLIESKFGEE